MLPSDDLAERIGAADRAADTPADSGQASQPFPVSSGRAPRSHLRRSRLPRLEQNPGELAFVIDGLVLGMKPGQVLRHAPSLSRATLVFCTSSSVIHYGNG